MLFVCHARMVWKLKHHLTEKATKKKDHIQNSKLHRSLNQDFWDSILPLVAGRLHEFTLKQILELLQTAGKPFVGKKSVSRILIGFAMQAADLLDKAGPLDPNFGENLNKLKEIVPAIFERQ